MGHRPQRDPLAPFDTGHIPGCAYDHNKPDESTGSCMPACPIGGLETRKRLIRSGVAIDRHMLSKDEHDFDDGGRCRVCGLHVRQVLVS